MKDNTANKTYNITTNTTTIIPGKIELINIIINTKGASSNLLKIYDSNSTIGANSARLKGTIDTSVVPGPFPHAYPLFDGLYIVTSAGTPADVTVVYKEMP
jgi:hypothetical protein